MRNEVFGRLLKAGIGSIVTVAGKTAPLVEDELGSEIGVAPTTIQYYKTGNVPAEPRTIEILATACVRRGLLGREWLQRFLHEARYPTPDKLLDQLYPIGPARQRPPRIYENLPAPTYSQFIMRSQALAEVVEGLSKRSAAVLIVGFGGNGKTSLAREVAARCLRGEDDAPQFDAAVWVSDKDRPGTTNLSVVLDEIARTLDYPGFTQFEYEEKRREVEQLLRRQRVLVVVDNFETITDGALLSWLLNLPEPSKALITTREYRREFRRSSWPVDLRGMTEAEARELIGERVRVLKIEKLVGDLTQLDPLLAATGGNPKAIEITIGLLKYERRPLQQVVDDLYAARGELFDDLFTRAWALLNEAARRVLLVTTFFPADASGEALSATADVQAFAFTRAVERLVDLALFDVHQGELNSAPRYALHPLVSAFARARLAEQHGFEQLARDRWVDWYVRLTARVGYCWNDLARFTLLDQEHETVLYVLKWAFQKEKYREAAQIARDIDYYYYMRGLWDYSLEKNLLGAEAARRIGDEPNEVFGLWNYVILSSRQGNILEAESHLPRLHELAQSPGLSHSDQYDIQHALAVYWHAQESIDAAEHIWLSMLARSEQLSPMLQVEARYWLGLCRYRNEDMISAGQLLQDANQLAQKYGYVQGVISTQMRLIQIDLDRGRLDKAEYALGEIVGRASNYRRRIADIQYLNFRLHTLRGDLPAARMALTEAIDLFERLGVRRELAEAREELARLETTIASASEPAPA